MTIALGTFPDMEATRICKLAKGLTKVWRLIYPRPSVEWVKQSLESEGIRVVNSRPGRQSKKDGSPNQKAPVTGKTISFAQQITTSRSLISCVSNPNQPTGTETMNPHTDWVTNITEGGIPSKSKVQANSDMIAPKEPVSNLAAIPLISNHTIPSTSSQQCNDDHLPVATKRTRFMVTDKLEKDQLEGRFAHPDLEVEDLDHVEIYKMLQTHQANLKAELEEIDKLRIFYRHDYYQQKRHHQNRKSESRIDQQFVYPVTVSPTPKHPMEAYQDCQDDQIETSQTIDSVELPVLLDDTKDNESVTEITEV